MFPFRRQIASFSPYILERWFQTLKWEVSGWDKVSSFLERGPVFFACLHSRFLMLPFLFPPQKKGVVLVSPSRDGDLLLPFFEKTPLKVVRGSSRRGGVPSLRALWKNVQEGFSLTIAVDGPLGPPGKVKPALVRFVRALQLPVVPVTYTSLWGISLPTWDRFYLPAPFSPALLLFGVPFSLSRDGSLEKEVRKVENALLLLREEEERWKFEKKNKSATPLLLEDAKKE